MLSRLERGLEITAVPHEVRVEHGAPETSCSKCRVTRGVPDALGHHPLLAVIASALTCTHHIAETPMTTRLCYVWFLSAILGFALEFLTPAMLALLSP